MSDFVPPRYQVLYAFNAEEEGELTCSPGDILELAPGDDGIYFTDDDEKDGWLQVVNLVDNNSFGFVPEEYVKELPPPPTLQAKSPAPEPSHPPAHINVPLPTSPPAPQDLEMSLQDLAADLEGPPPRALDYPAASYLSAKRTTELEQPTIALTSSDNFNSIRRLSDPRLTNKLLNTMDAGGGAAGTPLSSTAPARLTPTTAKSTAMPAAPRTPLATTPAGKMSTRAAAIHASLHKIPSIADDRLLFSAVKNLDKAPSVKYNPALVQSIRSEDYAGLLRKNTDAYARIGSDRKSTFTLATKMGDALAKKIGERNGQCKEIEEELKGVGDRLEKERQKWAAKLRELSVAC